MIWLIGNKGMLGTEVERTLERAGLEVEGTDREVDITSAAALEAYAAGFGARGRRLEWIVNCAAYTAVDRAEDDAELCFRLNRDGAENIAKTAAATGAGLIHISTDYVFDGNHREPYREEDSRSPIGVYAKSKAEGEEAIERTMENFYILRTAWLYGKAGGNFVSTMLRLCKERDEISVVADQFGSPTYAVDLAEAIGTLITARNPVWGVYHFTNEGETTWHEFASEIQRQALSRGLLSTSCRINAITTEQYPTKARRPKYSTLSKEKITRTFALRIRPWQEALSAFMEELARG
jgi:dTDP-4-dehydrorhamnose reductase